MGIHLEGCEISNNGIGISAPESANVTAKDTKFINNGVSIEVRSDDILAKLSPYFKEGVPHAQVIELIKLVQANPTLTDEQKTEAVKSKGLDSWLEVGANAATIVSAIAAFFI
ncbi:TPA: hypothetical protein ACK1LG_004589 [Klebsiella pneumoniae]|uniref:hypothetical protein n=1 Tax=Klebsiella pneumoniae TaxID=573 RepID=UPI002273FC6D|nr:hypothetical protein [Klebsiella pneumoniae]ELJ2016720.1 hypothetical protein [Klebsiella pneumoniae]HBR1961163.1 hypothetical protein [Klebsiella pneumoniae]HBR1976528.1 hypothetical protein [Klebsiella pneumoniae]HBT0297400.1 hypothetical protein [Klebsiella pneumoniae]